MGILDNLGSQATGNATGSNPLMATILQMIQNQPGGLQGLVQSFHEKGLSGLVASWIGTGQNLPVSSDQVQQVFGNDKIKELAAKAGISPDMASAAIAGVLPSIVDKLTPGGSVPEHSNVIDMATNMLKNLESKAS